MSFPGVWGELLELARRTFLHTKNAGDIMRKSGFRSGGVADSGPGPILSMGPCVKAGGCPRPPYGAHVGALGEGEREAFYEVVEMAEVGNALALEDVHDYLIAFGLEDTIVLNYILEMARYDWDGTPATFILNPTAACPIEIDVVLPANAFWEQYKTGDTRFADHDLTNPDNHDWRTVIKSFTFRSREVQMGVPDTAINMNGTAIIPYPVCPPAFPIPESTHYIDGVFTSPHAAPAQPTGIITVGYQGQFDSGGTNSPAPTLHFTTDRMLANKVSPEKDNTGVGNGPDYGIYVSSPLRNIQKFTFNQLANTLPRYIDTRWRRCVDPPPGLETTLECFPALVPELFPPNSSVDSSTTYADYRFYREPPIGRVSIDWTEDPPVGDTSMVRYDFTWPTFEVVAVRMTGSVPSLTPGSYNYP